MRSQGNVRVRPRRLVAGALVAGTTLSAAAIAVAAPSPSGAPTRPTAAPAQAAPPPTVTARVSDRHLRYRERVVVRGRLAPTTPGATVALEHAAAGRQWRRLRTAAVRADGRYRLHAKLHRSGRLRVVSAAVRTADDRAAAAAARAASRAHRVAVAAQVRVATRAHHARAGETVRVRGALQPRERGTRVTVSGRVGGRWRALGHARTARGGRFVARVRASAIGAVPLRVHVRANRHHAATTAAAGTLRAYRAGVASWYALYGNRTACGQILTPGTHGVAHKTLPCGTRVTIRYRGRAVTVPVIDRGPFTPGREWDLTGATARALGFAGVGTVWTTA